jgi:arylsulfatase A-like enzyme
MRALVLVARGLHLGYIGCYGNEWIQTPTMDRLAAEGVVFDQHYADEPAAAAAERAWLTGCYRFPRAKEDEESAPEAANFFHLVAEHGVETYLIRDDRDSSLGTAPVGWQQFHLVRSASGIALAEQMLAALGKALDRLSSCQEWLLRLDLGILLPPWDIPDEFRDLYATELEESDEGGRSSARADVASDDREETEDLASMELPNRYAAAVTFLDATIGQVLQELDRRGLLDELLIVLTSDRGQKLGEDTLRPGSRLSLHEELVHIPLILRLPGKAEAGRRSAALTQPVDVLPTLLEAFGAPLPAVHGGSLLPLARGERKQIRDYACSGFRTGENVEWALRSADWAFLLPASSLSSDSPLEPELYVKPDDRWEVNNVRHHRLDVAERLEETLRCFVETTPRPGPLQPPALPELRPEQNLPADSTETHIPS